MEKGVTEETMNKAINFLREKKKITQTELQFLGQKKMQISYPQVREVMARLEDQKKIRVTHTKIGVRYFWEIEWIAR